MNNRSIEEEVTKGRMGANDFEIAVTIENDDRYMHARIEDLFAIDDLPLTFSSHSASVVKASVTIFAPDLFLRSSQREAIATH